MNMPSAEFSTSDTTPPHEADSIGGTVLMRALADENVEFIWGYPGGSVLYIYDELYKQDQIQHILVRHEQAAVHAADAYSRATGKVGVCLVTSGPGVTNAVTGIATATWIPFRSSSSAARCLPRRSASTRSRSAIPSASRVRA